MQLSPNRVSEDFDFGTMDVFPMFTVSPETDGYPPRVSTVSSLGSPVAPTAGLHLLSEPLIPLPDMVFLHADPTLLLDLAQSYNNCILTHEPVALVSPPSAFLSREGPLDASTEPAAISNHPLISAGLTGCPYRMTTYRKADLASVDTSFGVQIHHPRFLECIGAPESARLLGQPPAEWLSIMDSRDALRATFQLQREAGLMSSNLTVYTNMRPCLARSYIPVGVVEEAAPVARVLRASTQMEVMGLWQSPVGLVGSGPDTAPHDEDCPGCIRCHPRPSS